MIQPSHFIPSSQPTQCEDVKRGRLPGRLVSVVLAVFEKGHINPRWPQSHCAAEDNFDHLPLAAIVIKLRVCATVPSSQKKGFKGLALE